MLCESQEFLPGQRGMVVVPLRRGRHLIGVFVDPATAATFTIERIDELSPGEMLALGAGSTPGALLVVRNDAPRVARFRAQLQCAPNLPAMERNLARIVERDWAAAYDRAIRHGGKR